MAASRCPVLAGFDPLAPEFLADPYTVLAALPLREAPLFYAPSIGYYVLTRHADIAQVFRDPVTFSAAVAQAPLVPLVPEATEILLAGTEQHQCGLATGQRSTSVYRIRPCAGQPVLCQAGRVPGRVSGAGRR